jgi:hypothetical protein
MVVMAPGTRHRVGTLVFLVGSSLVLPTWGQGTAVAASGPTTCAAGTCTASFTTSGAPDAFVVPAGVTSLTATVAGGSGGLGHPDEIGGLPARSGGAGGQVVATVPVHPGEMLTVVVGGKGEDSTGSSAAGGYGGGGVAENFGGSDGAGGGGSFLFRGSAVLVASGGGGGGGYQDGGDGGAGGPGASGSDGGPADIGGHGATTSAAGAGGAGGGVAGTGPAHGPDTFGTGGTNTACPGGGGGGGYYGGGSGGCAAIDFGGGGGGSGFLASGVGKVSAGTHIGDGLVMLSWRPAAQRRATTTRLRIRPHVVNTGGRATLTARVTSTTGTPHGKVVFRTAAGRWVGKARLVHGVARIKVHAGHQVRVRHFVAVYKGTSRYAPSRSARVRLTVAPPSLPNTGARWREVLASR